MIEAFPLQWPDGFERAKIKKSSQFKCTLGQARDGVLAEIDRLNGKAVVISTNIPVKKDGQLYASQKPVDNDQGVAVYFTWKGDQYVLACDQYDKIHENLRAIQKSIEAIRGLERWGASDILKRAFTGFKALPANAGPSTQAWWQVLGIQKDATEIEIVAIYKSLAKRYHPDNQATGNKDKFLEIKEAYQQALSQITK